MLHEDTLHHAIKQSRLINSWFGDWFYPVFDVCRTGFIQFQNFAWHWQLRPELHFANVYLFVVVNNQVDTAEIEHQQSPQQFPISLALVRFFGILERQIQRGESGILRRRFWGIFIRWIRPFSEIPVLCDDSRCCFLSLRICIDKCNSLFEWTVAQTAGTAQKHSTRLLLPHRHIL